MDYMNYTHLHKFIIGMSKRGRAGVEEPLEADSFQR